jgi:hypothetical protein
MDMLEKLRQQPKSHENVQAAAAVINDAELSFSEKVDRVQALEDMSSGFELELFGEVYSSLHSLAQTQEDINLISGV